MTLSTTYDDRPLGGLHLPQNQQLEADVDGFETIRCLAELSLTRYLSLNGRLCRSLLFALSPSRANAMFLRLFLLVAVMVACHPAHAQTWTQLPGSLSYISAAPNARGGADYLVGSINGQAYQFNFATNAWVKIFSSDVKYISAGIDGVMWIVDLHGNIWRYLNNKWQEVKEGGSSSCNT